MKIAIVGSSHLSEVEEMDARKYCAMILQQALKDNLIIDLVLISGGAKGVDTIAEEIAKGLDIKTEIFKPLEQNKDHYRIRNQKIAHACDVLYSLATVDKGTPCYHCDIPDHQVTGGCWTAKMAREKKKDTITVVLK